MSFISNTYITPTERHRYSMCYIYIFIIYLITLFSIGSYLTDIYIKSYQRMNFNEELINKENINWKLASQFSNFTTNALVKNKGKIDWNIYSMRKYIEPNHIILFQNELNWKHLIKNEQMYGLLKDYHFIDSCKNNINLIDVCIYYNNSFDFCYINNYNDKLKKNIHLTLTAIFSATITYYWTTKYEGKWSNYFTIIKYFYTIICIAFIYSIQ